MIGEDLYWKPLTEKGEALTKAVADLLTEDAAADEIVEKEKEAIHNIIGQLPYTHLSLEGWNGDVLMEKFEDPLWDELYKPCLACGTCTFVCPTCQCYDIKDYDAERTACRDTAAGILYVLGFHDDGAWQ